MGTAALSHAPPCCWQGYLDEIRHTPRSATRFGFKRTRKKSCSLASINDGVMRDAGAMRDAPPNE
eukprot:scaffold257444_cov41-Tisochrysis_lutea.AAC.2